MYFSLGIEFSFGREHPSVGHSLRIFSEESILRWIECVPLLNPVHAARFLLWHSGTGCPPGLHISQYMDLGLGLKDTSAFESHPNSAQARARYLEESVFLISLACMGRKQIAFDRWWHLANLANVEHAKVTLNSLMKEGYVRKSLKEGACCLELTHRGFGHLKEFDTFWEQLLRVNPLLVDVSSS